MLTEAEELELLELEEQEAMGAKPVNPVGHQTRPMRSTGANGNERAEAENMNDIRGTALLSPFAGVAKLGEHQYNRLTGKDNSGISDLVNRALPQGLRKQAGGVATGGASGLTFSFDDELAGLFGGSDAKAAARNAKQVAREDTPVAYYGGEIAGGIASPVNKALAPVAGIQKAKTLGGTALQGARAGGVYGGLYGAGSAEGGLQERLKGSAVGAGAGVLFGGALGPLAKMGMDKFTTGQFLPKPGSGTVLEMSRQQPGVGRRGAKLFSNTLSESGLSGEDIRSVTAAVNQTVEVLGKRGERVPSTAMLYVQELQKRGYQRASKNIEDVVGQLSASDKYGQALNRGFDDMKATQEPHMRQVFDDALGPESVAQVRASQLGEAKAAMQHREKLIEGIPQHGGAAGQIRKRANNLIERWSTDRGAKSALERAARDLGYADDFGVGSVAKAMSDNPAKLVNQLQSNLRTSSDDALRNLRAEAQSMLDDASRIVRTSPNSPFPKKNTDAVAPYKQDNTTYAKIMNAQEVADEANGLLTIAKDPRRNDMLLETFQGADDRVKRAFFANIKSEVYRAFNSGRVKNDEPWLTRLENRGLHKFLESAFGDEGKRMSRTIQQMVDEQQFIKRVDSRTWGNKSVKAARNDKETRHLYTPSKLAKLGDNIPAQAQFADLLLTPATGIPWVTMAKQGSRVFRPQGKSVQQLASILAARPQTVARTAGRSPTAAPTGQAANALAQPNAPAAPSAPASGGNALTSPQSTQVATRAPQPASVNVSQPAAPSGPSGIVPIVEQVMAKVKAGRIQRLEQKTANAQTRQQWAEQSQALDVRLAEAKAKAEAARQAERAAKRSNKSNADAAAARQRVLAAEQEEAAAKQVYNEARAQARTISDAGEREATAVQLRALAGKQVSKAEAQAKRRIGDEMARAGKSPDEIYERTGQIYLKSASGTSPAPKSLPQGMTPAQAQKQLTENYSHTQPDKWPRWVRDYVTNDGQSDWGAVVKERMAGLPNRIKARRQREMQAEQNRKTEQAYLAADRKRNRQRVTRPAMALTAAGGAVAGGNEINKRGKAKQATRYRAMEQNKDITKLVQEALKASGNLPRRSRKDGRWDTEVSNALVGFQYDNGQQDVGELNPRTIAAMVQALEAAGKPKEAEMLRIRAGKAGLKDRAENFFMGQEQAQSQRIARANQR